jgi:hypothetical protein
MTSSLQSNDHTSNSSTTNNNINNMTTSTIVSPGFETSTLLQSIYALTSPTQVGTTKFMTSYCINLEKLSIQAHLSARFIGSLQSSTVNVNGSNSGVGVSGVVATPGLGDILSTLSSNNNNFSALNGVGEEEYIVQAFLDDTTKIECLVSTLLSIELWREHVLFGSSNKQGHSQNCNTISEEEVEFEIEGGQRDELNDCYDELNDVDGGNDNISSHVADSTNDTSSKVEVGLANKLASNNNALRTAFILHAETTIVSLLSLIFYKGIPPELLDGSSGDDVLLSLIDYCARQLVSCGILFG